MRAAAITETCIYAEDLHAAESFYSRVLGLKKIAQVEGRHVFFRCGDGVFLVFNPNATAIDTGSGIPPHGAHGPGHVAFHMEDADISDWRDHLHAHNIEIESEYTWPNGGFSLYFRDPDGNSVELVTPRTWGFR